MKHTLLIVEDDNDTSEMLRVYFEAQGYRVVTAASGNEALEKGRQQLPDLILLDIRLPDIDGFAFIFTRGNWRFWHGCTPMNPRH